ncbi:helix-turn-helix domain-containing protein [Streptomyces sp. NPDC101062]|uniref:helix-turn-helix domain-containing protein n=1 Tax=unclassified Streptomyces TaxID=2593676 RepID=UPI00381AF35E
MYELRRFGALLREWRGRVPPAEPVGGSAGSRRRTPGLRREDLAELSKVSEDYIKRLEQGRARPSLQVLNAVARALALSRAEYEHLCILTGHAIAQPGQVNRRIGPATRQLLDRLESVPVAVFDATWTLLTYNALGSALCGDPTPYTRRDRNMAWRYFTNTTNCEVESERETEEFEASLVAELREAASRYPSDRGLTSLVTALHTASAPFADLWQSGATAKFERRRGIVDHPDVGPVRMDGNVLAVPEGDLKMLIYTTEPGSADAGKLAALRARAVASGGPGAT